MIVLVIHVTMIANVAVDTSSSNSSKGCDLLQIEDPFTGNSQQDATVDIGMFPRELKDNFSAVVKSRFGISSADCVLLDSPPTVVLRNYEKCLPDMKKLSEFMSFVIEFLKQNNYLKSDYHVTVDRILRDKNISEFFFNYYEQARSAIQNIIAPESPVQQSINQGNVLPKYLLYTFHLEHQTILDAKLITFVCQEETVLDRIILSCQSIKKDFLLLKSIPEESDRMGVILANVQSTLPFSFFSTPAEVNEQLFPLFDIDVRF
jgi:hypothetical protein